MKRLFVTVGTDHHRFDRLVRWADDYASQHPDIEVFVQYGHSAAPRIAAGSRLLDHSQLTADLDQADAVIVHGGPATIAEARRAGHQPICIPRDPERDEHVDRHQLRFVARLAISGLVDQCLEVTQLDAAVAEALERPRRPPATVTSLGGSSSELSPAVRRIGELLQTLSDPPQDPAAPKPITVLYIGGQGRSGSTMLERAVGELPGIVGVGEVVHLWLRGLRDNELCGCGEPFHSCPFWVEVGQRAFGGWDSLDADAAVDLRYRVDRNRYLPFILKPKLRAAYHKRHTQYIDRLSLLYRAISEVSGARVIVDSSKHASYALLLSQTPGINLRLLHIVRDSRAVVHAWSRQVRRPEAIDSLMTKYGPVKASALWDVQNTVIETLKQRHPYLRVRYEDFVNSPKDTLLQIAPFADPECPEPSLPFLDGATIELGPSHSVAGNPMRFSTGPIAIRADDRWLSEMPVARRLLVDVLTKPLNAHYGYRRGRP